MPFHNMPAHAGEEGRGITSKKQYIATCCSLEAGVDK